MDKKILDPCCGGKMFWFDENPKNVLFMDRRNRTEDIGDGRVLAVNPDIVGDFRKMELASETFYLVVFDPPHLMDVGCTSRLNKKYGKLDKNYWRSDLALGFSECWRVLKPNGTLVFKWNEEQIKLSEVLMCFHEKPLFGNRRAKTHWLVFFKDLEECNV